MADYAIIVPKHDELRSIEWAFGTSLREPDERTPSGIELYRRDLPAGRITFALLDKQTNTYSSILTADVISKEQPRLIFLVGTAMGNPHQVPVGAVVVADGITDISEKRLVAENGSIRYVPRGPVTSDELTLDARDFIARHFTPHRTHSVLRAMIRRPALLPRGSGRINELIAGGPTVACEPIVSGNEYHMDCHEASAGAVWDQMPGARAYDMEAAGFALAAHYNGIPWLVVRGISDHGTTATKSDENRTAAAALAGRFLAEFLSLGLLRAGRLLVQRPAAGISSLRDAVHRMDGTWWGAMAYVDNDENPVVFEEHAELIRSGAGTTGIVSSRRVLGSPRQDTLEYRVAFSITKHDYVGGLWSETGGRDYFGVLLGQFDRTNGALTGTWLGTHQSGVRRGLFAWKYVRRDGRPTGRTVDLDTIAHDLVAGLLNSRDGRDGGPPPNRTQP
jgi:nucleoside phosphorylase